MNVLPYVFASQFGVELYSLSEVGFSSMSMKCTDNREILLHYQIYLDIKVEGIQRRIRLFFTFDIPEVSHSERLNLLLGIPQLFVVNAVISIRRFKIEIGDPIISEKFKTIIRPELVFYKDHNLLIYSKAILTLASGLIEKTNESDKNSNNSNNLSEVDEDKGFQKIPDTILNYLILPSYVPQQRKQAQGPQSLDIKRQRYCVQTF